MIKRNYKITPEKREYGTILKVEMWDKYNNKRTIFVNDLMNASKEISNYWKTEDKRNHTNELLGLTIKNLNEWDKKNGILTKNYDGLD
tara:strand:+ start:313 stop:576 length:264 start_codon:yes stop_codon:yes gene_type:complete